MSEKWSKADVGMGRRGDTLMNDQSVGLISEAILVILINR
jgi:hypothetical protein